MNFLLFGFGNFSQGIAAEILKHNQNNQLKLYLRPSTIKKRDTELNALKNEYEDRVKIVSGELDEEKEIKLASEDSDVVIFINSPSPLFKSDEEINQNYLQELHVINAIKDSKRLKRYIPNNFAQMPTVDGPHHNAKKIIHERIIKENIPYTSIYCGWLMDILWVYTQQTRFETENKIIVSALVDVWRLVPILATDDRTRNHSVYINGDQLSQREIFEKFNVPFDVEKMKSYTAQEYSQLIESKKEKGEPTINETYAYSLWFFDGTRMGDALDIKELYPQEKLLTTDEFVKQNVASYKLNM